MTPRVVSRRFPAIVLTLKYLPFTLPSRTDPLLVFLSKSVGYLTVGMIFMGLLVAFSPSSRSLAFVYWENLAQLRNVAEQVLDALLGLILLWCTAYSIGIATVEFLRRPYRDFIVRKMEKWVSKETSPGNEQRVLEERFR